MTKWCGRDALRFFLEARNLGLHLYSPQNYFCLITKYRECAADPSCQVEICSCLSWFEMFRLSFLNFKFRLIKIQLDDCGHKFKSLNPNAMRCVTINLLTSRMWLFIYCYLCANVLYFRIDEFYCFSSEAYLFIHLNIALWKLNTKDLHKESFISMGKRKIMQHKGKRFVVQWMNT